MQFSYKICTTLAQPCDKVVACAYTMHITLPQFLECMSVWEHDLGIE